jgi:hypothetical protein
VRILGALRPVLELLAPGRCPRPEIGVVRVRLVPRWLVEVDDVVRALRRAGDRAGATAGNPAGRPGSHASSPPAASDWAATVVPVRTVVLAASGRAGARR